MRSSSSEQGAKPGAKTGNASTGLEQSESPSVSRDGQSALNQTSGEIHIESNISVPYQLLVTVNCPKRSVLDLKKQFKSIAYINRLQSWWPPNKIAESIGIPGYNDAGYNVLVYTFHLNNGLSDAALLYSDPIKYFGTESSFGQDKEAI